MTRLRTIMCQPHALVLLCATSLITAVYIALAAFQHRHFLTHAHDLGIFDHGVWQLSQFQRPALTVRFMPLPNMFGDHFHPILFLLVPWYWVFDSPLVLLVAQALLFAAAVPLGFLVARQLGIPRWPAVALAGAIGIHPGFTSAIRFDFHEVAFGPVLLLTMVLLAEQKRWRWYWLALAGFLMLRSFLYLPVLSWTMWPVSFITMAERFWSISPNLWLFHAQYQVIMTTVLFVSTLYMMHDARSRLARWPGVTGTASVLVLVATAWTALASGVWRDAFTSAPASTIERWHMALQQHIPPAARVSAQGPFVPHLSHRSTIYQFPRVRDAEYVVLDPEASSWPLTADDVRVAQQRLATLGWRIAWQQDTTVIFQRTGASEGPPTVRGWE